MDLEKQQQQQQADDNYTPPSDGIGKNVSACSQSYHYIPAYHPFSLGCCHPINYQ